MRTNNRRKSTISVKMFLAELGDTLPTYTKDKLMELDERCFLTRKTTDNKLELKHVEHLLYEIPASLDGSCPLSRKEYTYGQFVIIDGNLHFSENCLENKDIAKAPIVSLIYNGLSNEEIITENEKNLKKIDENNVSYVVDSILEVCPQVSEAYQSIVKGMVSRSNYK